VSTEHRKNYAFPDFVHMLVNPDKLVSI